MKKTFICLMIILYSSLFIVNVKATSLSMTKGLVDKSGVLTEGVNYEKFSSNVNSTYRNVSYVKKDASASNVKAVVWSGTYLKYSRKTVLDIAKDYELQHPGSKVIAGINGDYFEYTYGNTINAHSQEGELISASNHTKYSCISISDDSKSFVQSKTLTTEGSYYLTIYDKYGKVIDEVKLGSQNTEPNSINDTTFYYEHTNGLALNNTSIYLCNSLKSYVSKTVQCQLFKGKINGTSLTTPTSSSTFAIATINENVKDMLSENPTFKVSKYLSSGNNGYSNVIGVGSRPLKDGEILDYSAIGDQDTGTSSTSFCRARVYRSSIGWSNDGDLIIAAMDGNTDLREEACIMKALGCDNAFNFDGGGSTQLIYRNDNGVLSLLNVPSGTRAVANAVLFVLNDVGAAASFSQNENDITADISIKAVNNVEIKKINYYLNNVSIGETKSLNDTIDFDLNSKDLVNYFSIDATYVLNNEEFTINLLNKRFVGKYVKSMASNFKMNFISEGNNFKAIVTCDDVDSTITVLYIYLNGKKAIADKTNEGYVVKYMNMIPFGTFEIEIKYIYLSINPQIKRIEDKYYPYEDKPSIYVISYINNSMELKIKDIYK